MKKTVRIALTVSTLSLASFAFACGDVCDDAADVCNVERGDGDCEGEVERIAECIVDADSCSADTLLMCGG